MSWNLSANFVPSGQFSTPSSPAKRTPAAPRSAPVTPEKSSSSAGTVWSFGDFKPSGIVKTPEKTVSSSLPQPSAETLPPTEKVDDKPAAVVASPPIVEPEPVKKENPVVPVVESQANDVVKAPAPVEVSSESSKSSETSDKSQAIDSVPEPDWNIREPVYEKGYWTPQTPEIKRYNFKLMLYWSRSTFSGGGSREKIKRFFPRQSMPKLPSSASGWKRLDSRGREELKSQINLILNRLVSTNCKEMTEEILKLPLNSEKALETLVELIYEKAVKEVKYVKVYGKMCGRLEKAELHKRIEDLPEGSNVTFRRLLTDHCHKAFRDDLGKWMDARSKSREGISKEQIEELDLELGKAKGRYLGNMMFISQLFLVQIVSVKILTDCIVDLIKSAEPPDEECIETLCKLMESVGKQLQDKLSTREDSSKLFVETVFKRLERYSKMTDKYPPRIRFLLMSTIEMREEWNPVPRSASPMIHAPTPKRTFTVTPSISPGPTPFPSTSRLGDEREATPCVSPDQPKVTKEAQAKAINVIETELSQYISSRDRNEFMESMKESLSTSNLFFMIIPGVLRFLLCSSAGSAKTNLDIIKPLVVDFINDQHVMIKDGLDYFTTEFNEYGEDSPSCAAEVTGVFFSALLKNDEDDEYINSILACLANIASDNPFWNAPNKSARAAGFAASVLVEMLCDFVKEQEKSGNDPYAVISRKLDLQPIDIRAMMPDSPDDSKSLAILANLLKENSLDCLFPALCDRSIVIDPLAAQDMQPLTPEKLIGFIERTKAESGKGATTYFALLIAEEVFNALKKSTVGGNIQLKPWIPVLKALRPSSSVHYEVGIMNAMCRCWSATGKKAHVLESMAKLVKESGIIELYAFDKWRIDSSDRNSTLKDEAYNNELTSLF